MTAPQPVFEAPWHAEAFAIAVHLQERGLFSWPDWVSVFSSVLKEHGLETDLDGGDDYFRAWVTALERLLASQGLADGQILAALKEDWAQAYMQTPHGAPVRLTGGRA